MGAIVRIDKMPEKCNECQFANKEKTFCRLRNTGLIAGKQRPVRMPLCPLVNEGTYLTKQLRKIKFIKTRKGQG